MRAATFRDRLLGFLRGRDPASRDSLFAGDEPPRPSTCPKPDADLVVRFGDELRCVGGELVDRGGVERLLLSLGSEAPGATVVLDGDPAREALEIDLVAQIESSGLVARIVDAQGDREDLVGAALGVTVADHAIAETGTIVQCARPFRPRAISLLPPRHLVVLPRARIVAALDDVLERVSVEGGSAGAPGYFTWITGPSRTADIEKVLTIGVHGPGRLSVWIPDDSDLGHEEAT